jgi:hypothetical protein
MSRVRDGIINFSESGHSGHMDTPNLKRGISQYIEKYINSLSSGYGGYFDEIIDAAKQKLEVLDFESLTMKKFEARR